MARGIVYLSNGRLFAKSDGDASACAPIESPFAQSIRQRASELQRRHAWKSQGRGAAFISGAALWGGDQNDPALMRIDITGVCRGTGDGDLFYALQSQDISGVLRRREGSSAELRILHTSDYRVGPLAAQPGTGRLALTIRHRGGSTIAVMGADGSEFSEITQGESMDESPCWVPNAPNRVVFQSAGLATNERGQTVGLGPYAIQMLDLETGRMTPIVEDAKTEFLAPKIAADGVLHYIRRPYGLAKRKFHLFRFIEDLLLLPFRLIYAIFQFLNFFTMRYTGKPLAKGGPGNERASEMPADMMLWGNLIQASKSMNSDKEGTVSLVPASWELCRHAKESQPEVLAKGVLSYDLENDGGIVYSNGNAIFRRSPEGKISRLHRHAMIQQVIAASYQPEAVAAEVSGLAALDAR
jgi:hypothetical protein